MKKSFIFSCLTLIYIQGFSQDYPDLRYYEAGSINLFYSHETEDNPIFLGVLTNEANIYFSKTMGKMDMQLNLLVLNPHDWVKYTSAQIIYGMPHWRRTDNSIIVASDDNFFWAANLPHSSQLESPYKELFFETYGTEDGRLSARHFFDLGTIHELAHLWLYNGRRETQRIWLEEIFCNLATLAFIESERAEWANGLDLLTDYHLANTNVPMQFTTLETFEENRMRIVMGAPHNYGWYQYRFIHAARLLYDAGGAEILKKLWEFLGKYQEKLSDEELKAKLAEEVHPYFKTLIDEW
jgi:hypothetical protein